MPYKKMLVRAPNWVGDGVMATPLLSALRTHAPKTEITLLAKPAVAALLQHHPSIDRIMLYEDPGKHSGPVGFLRLVALLRKEQFDCAFLLQNAFEAAFLATLSGIPKRMGYDTDGRGVLLTKRLSRREMPRHQRDAFSRLATLVGTPIPTAPPSLALTDDERLSARALLSSYGISPDDRIVGIFPGAAFGPAKQWIPARFAAVADQLVDRFHAKILILGGPSDRSVGETVVQEMKASAFLFAGKMPLREMMALLALCHLSITNDSGPMHIASAFGVPQVALFGPTQPERSFPAQPSDRMAYHPVNCSPCPFRNCPVNHHCMTAISVETVLDAVGDLLTKTKGG